MELDKRIVDAIEKQGWNILSTNEQDGLYYTEIENWSPAGENIVETVWHDGTPQSFANALYANYENFDPDEHAERWYNAGDRGQPKSMRVLLKDADEIESMLEELAIAVKQAIAGEHKMEYDGYYITWQEDSSVERENEDGSYELCEGVFVEVFLDEEHAEHGDTAALSYFSLTLGREINDMNVEEIKRAIRETVKKKATFLRREKNEMLYRKG